MEFDLRPCIEGDVGAWGAFVERWAGVIHAAVVRTLRPAGQADQAADVAQDVFVRLLKDERRLLRTFDAGRASLATWLTVVARSVAVSHLRRRRPQTVRLADAGPIPAAADPPPADDASAEAALADLNVPPDLLTARQRLVLQLLFDREMSVEQAAAVLAVDPQTVRSTRHKAISRLRAFLGRANK